MSGQDIFLNLPAPQGDRPRREPNKRNTDGKAFCPDCNSTNLRRKIEDWWPQWSGDTSVPIMVDMDGAVWGLFECMEPECRCKWNDERGDTYVTFS